MAVAVVAFIVVAFRVMIRMMIVIASRGVFIIFVVDLNILPDVLFKMHPVGFVLELRLHGLRLRIRVKKIANVVADSCVCVAQKHVFPDHHNFGAVAHHAQLRVGDVAIRLVELKCIQALKKKTNKIGR